jgi:hypothetical protein
MQLLGFIIPAGVLLWFVPHTVLAATVTLRPVADAEMRQRSPTTVLPSGNTIVSGTLGSLAGFEIRRGVFRFDLAGQIPAGAVINSVTVRMVAVFKIPNGPANSTFSLRRVLASWAENQVTWNSRLSGVPWAAPGALNSADVAAAASSSAFVTTLGTYTFPSTPALIDDVQGWLNNPANNFGWLLHTESESVPKTARHFGPRENAANAAQLIINYTIPSISIVTQPQSQTANVGDDVSFNVVANGASPLAYQWQFNGRPISGAASDTLQLNDITEAEEGDYQVTVSNQSGSVESSVARLTVSVPGQPFINITSPTNNALFPPGADVLITTSTGESNGEIKQVEFFLNTNSVGVVTNPFSLLLTNLVSSNYFLEAIATDARQLTATSSVVRFTVLGPPFVTQSVQPPGTNFPLGVTLTNTAIVTTDARVTNVQFFEGTNGLGSATNAPFTITWTPGDARLYSIIAVASDDFGLSGTSAPLVLRIHVPETVKPRIAITNGLPNFFKSDEPQITLSGTASDNLGLDHVEYQLENGPFLGIFGGSFMAEGSTNWQANINLVPGNNAIHIRSIDLAGNSSPVLTRFYTYFFPQPVTIGTNGSGTIRPDLNGASLEIGKFYEITAHPSGGYIFADWQGLAGTNNDATLRFVMQTNITNLVARFIPSPFVQGSYAGVYFDKTNVSTDSSGLVSFNLSQNGTFNGKLTTKGASYPVRGQFNSVGKSTLPVLRRALAPVVLGLQVDGSRLSGFVTNAVGINRLVSELFGGRNDFHAKTNPAPQAGQRDFLVLRSANKSLLGNGVAAIGTSGTVGIRGRWTNNSTFSLGSFLVAPASDGGNLPFYLSYRNGTEIIIGLPHFGPEEDDIAGELWWTREGTNGFLTPLELVPASN